MKTIITTALILTSTSVYAQDQTALNTQAIQDLVSYSQANRSGGAGNYEAINANANTIASNASAIEVIAERPAVSPLGSLSFAAASATFYGDGMGFGLSNSNYGSLEGSVVFGFDLSNDWRVVAGITTDFKGKTAGSVAVGVSF